MKIKVKVSKQIRGWIEDQEENYKKALVREVERHKKEMADTKKRLADYIKFWETNEKPVYDFTASQRVGGPGFHETEIIWVLDDGTINVNVLKPNSGWRCKFCKKEPVNKYVGCADSRYDETYHTCDCEGAKKNGIKWEDLNLK